MLKKIDLANLQPFVVVLGSHPGIIQSMLDYQYCLGHDEPNILVIIGAGRKQERYFWGENEIVIPVYADLELLPEDIKTKINTLLNVQSARRVLSSMQQAFEVLPNLQLANIFAEQVPENHSLQIAELADKHNVLVAGPASVGLLVPGAVKLGAIGGTRYAQIVEAKIFAPGNNAVISTSGGMVNELIHTVTSSGMGVSFAIALGGDRYPVTTPAEAFLMAQNDSRTERIVYFGELGGDDEYEIADLISKGQITKPVFAYIAGTVAELFAEPPQFGHAKALAKDDHETAKAKKAALKEVGVNVMEVFADLSTNLSQLAEASSYETGSHRAIKARNKKLIVSRVSGDVNGDINVLGENLLDLVESSSLAKMDISLLLGQKVESQKLIDFTDYVLRLLSDHGPYVSGALNTIVSARAGKDLASSLATGLLTIGPRFGGAVNAAAQAWLNGVRADAEPKAFVASFKSNGGIISGIGHKKYRLDNPDPRVKNLAERFANNDNGDRYLKFARSIEEITTSKKANLILNVDGTIAAIMLDLLESKMNYSQDKLQELVDIEFFNAIFILSRTAGLMAHYLDQRRNDEGLLRLSENDVLYIP